jgi:hypothetical protein
MSSISPLSSESRSTSVFVGALRCAVNHTLLPESLIERATILTLDPSKRRTTSSN